jgi:ribosomal protein L37AE/L43A
MTKIVGRIVDGVATTEVDLIPEKECPRCRKPIKKRVHYCEFCEYCYTEDEFAAEQEAFAKLEAQMKRQESEANRD